MELSSDASSSLFTDEQVRGEGEGLTPFLPAEGGLAREGGGGCLTFWPVGWRLIRRKAEFKSVGADWRKYGISSKHNQELNSEVFRPVKQN